MKAKAKENPENVNPPVSPATDELADAVDSVAEELRPLYHLEPVADNIGELANALHRLANATALSVIAKHGTEKDREAAVAHLKRWFQDSIEF